MLAKKETSKTSPGNVVVDLLGMLLLLANRNYASHLRFDECTANMVKGKHLPILDRSYLVRCLKGTLDATRGFQLIITGFKCFRLRAGRARCPRRHVCLSIVQCREHA